MTDLKNELDDLLLKMKADLEVMKLVKKRDLTDYDRGFIEGVYDTQKGYIKIITHIKEKL